jgi:hypothetical protein
MHNASLQVPATAVLAQQVTAYTDSSLGQEDLQ